MSKCPTKEALVSEKLVLQNIYQVTMMYSRIFRDCWCHRMAYSPSATWFAFMLLPDHVIACPKVTLCDADIPIILSFSLSYSADLCWNPHLETLTLIPLLALQSLHLQHFVLFIRPFSMDATRVMKKGYERITLESKITISLEQIPRGSSKNSYLKTNLCLMVVGKCAF